MPAATPPAIELSDSDVLPIDDRWSPAESIPMLEMSAIMEAEPAAPEQSPRSPIATRVAEPIPCLTSPPADRTPSVAPVASLSTSAPSPIPAVAALAALSTIEPSPVATDSAGSADASASDSLVSWQPRRRSFGWIMGSTAAASIAVILLGWSLAPTSASAESAAPVEAPEPVVLVAELPEPQPQAVAQVTDKVPDDRTAARRWATIGNRQLKDGKTATAQKMFERALAAQADNRMARAGLGKIALKRKQPRKALEHLRLAVEIEPRKADNRRLLAQAYMALGRKDKARTHLQKAISYGDIPAQQLLMDL